MLARWGAVRAARVAAHTGEEANTAATADRMDVYTRRVVTDPAALRRTLAAIEGNPKCPFLRVYRPCGAGAGRGVEEGGVPAVLVEATRLSQAPFWRGRLRAVVGDDTALMMPVHVADERVLKGRRQGDPFPRDARPPSFGVRLDQPGDDDPAIVRVTFSLDGCESSREERVDNRADASLLLFALLDWPRLCLGVMLPRTRCEHLAQLPDGGLVTAVPSSAAAYARAKSAECTVWSGLASAFCRHGLARGVQPAAAAAGEGDSYTGAACERCVNTVRKLGKREQRHGSGLMSPRAPRRYLTPAELAERERKKAERELKRAHEDVDGAVARQVKPRQE